MSDMSICLRIAHRGQLSRVVRYSLGALAYEMLTGLPPYYTQDTALGGLLLLLFLFFLHQTNIKKNGSTSGTKNLNDLYDVSRHSLYILFNQGFVCVCLCVKPSSLTVSTTSFMGTKALRFSTRVLVVKEC